MSTHTPPGMDRLAIHTITLKPWSLRKAVENYARVGAKGITVWRDKLGEMPIPEARDMISSEGLEVVATCRGGFFPGVDAETRQKGIDDNLKAIEEAHAIGAPMVVLVCGAVPGQPLEESRKQIQDGIEAVLPRAIDAGVKLAIEPLHPMYADDRSAINTLGQANDMCEGIGSTHVGVALDVYHLWWDPALEAEIQRCGELGALYAFHVCDWLTPTKDMLLDRGIMGDGCINVPEIRSWVESAGFTGMIEVEIFSNELWAGDQAEYLDRIVHAYQTHT